MCTVWEEIAPTFSCVALWMSRNVVGTAASTPVAPAVAGALCHAVCCASHAAAHGLLSAWIVAQREENTNMAGLLLWCSCIRCCYRISFRLIMCLTSSGCTHRDLISVPSDCRTRERRARAARGFLKLRTHRRGGGDQCGIPKFSCLRVGWRKQFSSQGKTSRYHKVVHHVETPASWVHGIKVRKYYLLRLEEEKRRQWDRAWDCKLRHAMHSQCTTMYEVGDKSARVEISVSAVPIQGATFVVQRRASSWSDESFADEVMYTVNYKEQ